MATDKSSKRGSLWAKTAGDRGWKVPRLPRGTICSGLRAAWDHISALVFPHLFSKNTTCLNEEYNCRWSRMSTRVDKCTFACRGRLAWALFEHFPKTEMREGGGGGLGMIHQWEGLECTSDKRDDNSVSDRWISPVAVKGAWKRCSHSSIHPRQRHGAPPGCPPKTRRLTQSPHMHTHTHSLVFTLERQIGDSHTFMHSNIHTHFHSHTHYHGRGELATSCWHFHRH